MRPGAILVSIASLLLSLSVVVWLSNSFDDVDVSTQMKKPEIADLPDTPRPTSDEGPQPTAEFAETKFDFGTMLHRAKGTHAFQVTNTGDAPLKLKAGKSTCQCTGVEVGAQEVAPGESTTIELSWEIKSPAEMFEHSAIIHTNAPEHENGEVRLIVHGTVVAEVSVTPPESLNLGAVTESGSSGSFSFYSRYHDQFQLLSVDCPHKSFTVDIAALTESDLASLGQELQTMTPSAMDGTPESESPPPRCGYRVTVSADDSIPVGTTDVPLTLHTDLKNVPDFTHRVSARRAAPFQFFPLTGTRFIADTTTVTTRVFDAENGVEMELLILATGLDEPLDVSVLGSDPAWLEVTVSADKSAQGIPRQRLTIRIPPGTPPVVRGADNPATIQLKTNHPKAEQLNLNATFLSR